MRTWLRLDNSALIYPKSITFTTQSLFRISAEVKENVNKELLLNALKTTLERLASFKVLLRKGFFRYFFYKNELDPVIFDDDGLFLYKINFAKNNRYLFKVSVFESRISVDFFHGLCDGVSALEFMRTLLFYYCRETGVETENDGTLKLLGQEISKEEYEDAFLRYNKPFKLTGGVVGRFAGGTAFQIKGKGLKTAGYGTTEGSISVEDIKAVAKKFNCSVTALIAANALLSAAEANKNKKDKYPLVVAIPVDLRRHFESKTLLNFTTVVKCKINQNNTERTLEAYCKEINEQLKSAVNKEDLSEQLSASNLLGVNPFLKSLPLFIKTPVIKLSKLLSGKTKQTLLVSNLSIVKLPKGASENVNKMIFNLNVSQKMPLNLAVITYNNNVTIAITSRLENKDIQKEFFKKLASENVGVTVVSNR